MTDVIKLLESLKKEAESLRAEMLECQLARDTETDILLRERDEARAAARELFFHLNGVSHPMYWGRAEILQKHSWLKEEA